MATPTTNPLVNGVYYDYSSIRIDIDDEPELLIKEIKYAPSVERGKVMGTSMRQLGFTRGQLSFEGSLVFSTREAFDRFLAARGERIFLDPVAFIISYGTDGQPVTTDTLETYIKKPQLGGSSGTDALEVSCDLDVIDITMGGNAAIPEGL